MANSRVVEVELSWTDVFVAAQVGVLRHVRALQSGLADKHGFDGSNGWTVHVEGAAGELALCKFLGVNWNHGNGTFKSLPDVGEYEVRTRSLAHYELIVRPDDAPERVYVLVIGRAPALTLVGWIRGADAKRPEWLQTHGGRPPAYFVPQDALTEIDKLVQKRDSHV